VPDAFIDANVLIHALRQGEAARAAIRSIRAGGEALVHSITIAELVAGASTRKELTAVQQMVSTFRHVVPDESDIRRSLALQERHALRHSVEWGDCVLAATSMRLRVWVCTRDRHFAVLRGVRVIEPY